MFSGFSMKTALDISVYRHIAKLIIHLFNDIVILIIQVLETKFKQKNTCKMIYILFQLKT